MRRSLSSRTATTRIGGAGDVARRARRSWTPYAGARERDALSTQTAGPPLAHTIPSFSELTSADIAIVNYL